MATTNGSRMFTVDKFLGVNESGDGDTELKMGEASYMENFIVSDAYNLSLRPGVRRMDFTQERTVAPILASWAGFLQERELLVLCDFADDTDRLFVYGKKEKGKFTLLHRQEGTLGLEAAENSYVSIFHFNGNLYVMSAGKTVIYTEDGFREMEPYIPLVIAGASPAGGGTVLENLNLLTGKRRIDYSADGESEAYVLPEEAVSVELVIIDNMQYLPSDVGSYDTANHTFTFSSAPIKGVGNVEFIYDTDHAQAEENRMQIIRCRLQEEYNGSTDTRLFLAGNGTNICYYSGVTQDGVATAMYFPALNEVAVDMSGSAVTGMIRHYSRLLVFKPDGTYSISYEPVTQTDGSTIAGFYLRPVNRDIGSEIIGQIQTVNNFPRTITKDGIYEWKITSSYYKDERYAARISDRVEKSLRGASLNDIVTCDDDYRKTYYVFLNDGDGTVLVNRYDLSKEGIWCIYKSSLFRNVRRAMVVAGEVIFVNDTEAFCFDDSLTRDASYYPGAQPQKITAVWESGYMHFGADFRRKYSSYVYVSVLPQANSEIIMTARTDKRDTYMEKAISSNVFQWSNANFKDWTFAVTCRPILKRVKLKVKKFVYYKLIFKIEKDGASGTILGYDQQVRFSSMAK